ILAPADAAQTDPEVIIYRFTGVRDNGDDVPVLINVDLPICTSCNRASVVTVFTCTNFSGATETIRFVTRDSIGNIGANVTRTVRHHETTTITTSYVFGYTSSDNPAYVKAYSTPGTAAIAATSTNVICTAMLVNPVTIGPAPSPLPGIRFNP